MSKKHESDTTATTTSHEPSETAGQSVETARKVPSKFFDASASEIKQGFRGAQTDPTPNEHYTVDGVTKGKLTPDTDGSSAAAHDANSRNPDKLPVKHPFQKHLQKQADAETKQGFRGAEVDKTPNENYSVAGVTQGLPTPETSKG